jgi:hypothetical protein
MRVNRVLRRRYPGHVHTEHTAIGVGGSVARGNQAIEDSQRELTPACEEGVGIRTSLDSAVEPGAGIHRNIIVVHAHVRAARQPLQRGDVSA